MAYKPDFPYLGDQIIINSGRVTLNSKDDSVFLFAKQAIGFSSAGTINFDADGDMVVNAKKIYLGLETDTAKPQPAIKGDNLENLLIDMLDDLNNLGQKLSKAKDSNGVGIPVVRTAGKSLIKSVTRLKTQIKGIKSDKTYTL
jgi:hypothetical protein